MNNDEKRILVTGGSGFIGYNIVSKLLDKGYKVRTLNRGKYKKLVDLGVDAIEGDIRNIQIIEQAVKDIDAVIHVASKIGYWGAEKTYYDINVKGTENLLISSKKRGVRKFIYTSTPSVIGYYSDVNNGKQDIPYPSSYLSPYSKTKAEAEQLVKNFNQDKIATVALRPHLVFGPGDTNLLPMLLNSCITGRLPIIGNKKISVDFTYIDNVVDAHLCALKALDNSSSNCAGKAYFISNNEPIELWSWLNKILIELGYSQIQKSVNRSTIYKYAHLLEIIWKVLPMKGDPPLTRFLVNALSRDHWYDMHPAKIDLNYTPSIMMNKATDETIKWLKKIGIGKENHQ